MLLDGNRTRDELKAGLITKVQSLPRPPHLAIVQVGENERSAVYISKKQAFAEEVGCITSLLFLKDESSTEEVIAQIRELNQNKDIDGVIVQLPLPGHIDRSEVIGSVAYEKDADALTAGRIRDLWEEKPNALIPATASGILHLLDHYQIPLEGKQVTIIGRSSLVGKPVAHAMLQRGAAVTVCHKQTPDIARYTKSTDIIISATGVSGLITAKHVSAGQTVIDVGISVLVEEGQRNVVGDVDRASVEPIVENLTPVPGGVGPMTVFALFENLVTLAARRGG